ncbi:MAG: hypothetical protein R3314_13320, partial [Longimicrobiales bacterium]|nr:hypothetical protein [Longimicrobiales bacterium]
MKGIGDRWKWLRERWREWTVVRRVVFVGVLAAFAAGAAGWTAATLVVHGVIGDGCPSIADLRSYRPPEATRVFATDG